jgi:glycerate dehydrogenase
MPTRIVILDGYTLNPGDISWELFARSGDLEIYDRSDAREIVERALGAVVVITNKANVSGDIIEQLPALKYIGITATGTNVVDVEAATKCGVVVTNVPAYGPESIAQHTIALLLELTNQVGANSRAVKGGQWAACSDFSFSVAPIVELAGKQIGIIGLGAIGSRVAEIAAALGMRITAHDPRAEGAVEIPGAQIEWLTLDDLFAQSDVVTLHCPLTDETRELVNAERLALMKPSSLLINAARGPLIDEQALSDALTAKSIAGAAVDVISVEPPKEGNILIDHPRCLVTPHVAWAARESRQRLLQGAAENLRIYLDGDPINVVNPEVLNG